MIETELKISLDPAAEARLMGHPDFESLRLAPRTSQTLVSVYHDTETHALAAEGISLRLRKIGRRWVQTIKIARADATGDGLFANHEIECPAPAGRLVLTGEDPAHAAIIAAAAGAPLGPLFETRVRRTIERLRAPGGGEVELAIDRGDIIAGDRKTPILEAELELKAGDVGDLYRLAAILFQQGPIRFGGSNKAARGYALIRGDVPAERPKARGAGRLAYSAEASVESVARDVLRDCFTQISRNLVVVADSDIIEGPHQLRVGLRRLRTALGVFRAVFGGSSTEPLNLEARRIGQAVSALRDLDVLIEDVARIAEMGIDGEARDALIGSIRELRESTRARVRAELASPATAQFIFDLGRFIEARGWLVPADYSQTARLAAPIGEVAPELLARRHRKTMKLGRGIEKFDAEALHTLRKELKKLRYAADMFEPLYSGRKVETYMATLKDLQDAFGSLNDVAMAEGWLTGPEAPGRAIPEAQRAAGWMLGAMAVRVLDDRPKLFERWHHLAAAKPFWT